MPCNKLILFLSLFWICFTGASGKNAADSLMEQLDEVIDRREEYLRQKEAGLSLLRDRNLNARDDRERFES